MNPKAWPLLAGFGALEYQLILTPHADLQERIVKLRAAFAETYKTGSVSAKTHITLATFVALGSTEEKLVNRLQHIAMAAPPFKVELNGFGSLPTHTIFINVTTKVAVQQLVTQLKDAQALMRVHKELKPHFIETPYLPLAQKLKPWQFEGGWQQYGPAHFSGRFVADAMLLLKRPLGGGAFQIAQRLPFQNLPVATKQGSLFL